MIQDLAQQAIEKALSGQWESAKEINLLIIKKDPNNIEAMNRLSKSYFELGNIKAAKTIINNILKIDPYNPIALRCFDKWKNLKKVERNTSKQMSPDMFLEEPGKTKIVHLIHPCDKPIMAKLNCGDIVFGSVKSHRISIVSDSGKYIGKLPDDVSIRMKKLMRIGYQYVLAIKSVDANGIKVFIRETFHPSKHSSKTSFSSEMVDYIPYTPSGMTHDRVDVSSLEDDSDMTASKSENEPSEGTEN